MVQTITATFFDNNTLRLRSDVPNEAWDIVTKYFPDATCSVNAAYAQVQLQRRHGGNLDSFLSDNRAKIINADSFELQIGQWKQRTGNLGVSSIMMTTNIFNSQQQLLPETMDDNDLLNQILKQNI